MVLFQCYKYGELLVMNKMMPMTTEKKGDAYDNCLEPYGIVPNHTGIMTGFLFI